MIVDFINVGASNHNWRAEVEKLDHDLFYKEVQNKGAIMSSDIDFSIDDSGINGQVIVGGMRIVGEFKVKTEANAQ
jgi:hypothetical protein